MDVDFPALAAAQSPVALVATTIDGVVQWWNPAAGQLFGYAADEALGRSLRALIVPPEQAEDDAALQREALAGGGERHEVLRRRKDGVPIYVDTRLHPLLSRDGRPAHQEQAAPIDARGLRLTLAVRWLAHCNLPFSARLRAVTRTA